jgi:hypothetical protein
VRVPVKLHAEHVPHLAFVPVRGRPEACDRGKGRRFTNERDFDPDVFIAIERKKMVTNGEIAFRLVLTMPAKTFIDGRKIIKHLVRAVHTGLEISQNVTDLFRGYPDRRDIIARGLDSENAFAKGCRKVVDDRAVRYHEKNDLLPMNSR